MKKCIICSGTQPDYMTYCAQCGFTMKQPRFFSKAHTQNWIIENILPYKKEWARKLREEEQQKKAVQAEKKMKELQNRIDTLQEQLKQVEKQTEDLRPVRVLTQENVRQTLQNSQTEYHVWDNVTAIAEDAFYGRKNLQRVYLPDSVKSIGKRAFCSCGKLEYIDFPEGWLSIDEEAFEWCFGLKEIFLSGRVIYIGMGAFAGCKALQSIQVDARNSAYYSDNGVLFSRSGKTLLQYPAGKRDTRYQVPSSAAYIAARAFHGCQNLEAVSISTGVTSIGVSGFSECQKLKKIILPSTVIKIEENAFRKCESLMEVHLPQYIMEIRESTFQLCSSLKRVYLPFMLYRIEGQAFAGCSSLQDIYLQDDIKLEHIASDAFYGVTAVVHYPKKCAGSEWVGKNYGGKLTWVPENKVM